LRRRRPVAAAAPAPATATAVSRDDGGRRIPGSSAGVEPDLGPMGLGGFRPSASSPRGGSGVVLRHEGSSDISSGMAVVAFFSAEVDRRASCR
jgi:hypothetical protein